FQRGSPKPILWGDIDSPDWKPICQLRQVRSDAPRGLARVIERAIEREASKRFADGEELSAALRAVRGELRRARWNRWGAIVALAFAAGIAFIYTRPGATRSGPAAGPAPSPPTQPSALTDLPPPTTSTPEAAALYAVALQQYRQASSRAAVESLRRALEL